PRYASLPLLTAHDDVVDDRLIVRGVGDQTGGSGPHAARTRSRNVPARFGKARWSKSRPSATMRESIDLARLRANRVNLGFEISATEVRIPERTRPATPRPMRPGEGG